MWDELRIRRNFVRTRWFIVLFVASACVERVELGVPPPQSLMVIEGMITTDAPPYTVKVSRGFALDADTVPFNPVKNLTIQLFDDQGNSENFVEKTPGEYISSGSIQGQIGHSYHIKVQTPDGKIFESDPDLLKPVGYVTDIRFEYERRTKQGKYFEEQVDVFNVFVDSDAGSGTDNYVRWRLTGTYKIDTYPQYYMRWTPPYTPYMDPWPCSGYRVGPGPIGSGGTLIKFDECSCCTCWAKQYEQMPQLSDVQLVVNNQFKNVKVGEVPITNMTFANKYLVEMEQLSLSKNAFEFYKLVRKQKEEASTLFQPPPGIIVGNVFAKNNSDFVVGMFGASSISKKSIFIYPTDVPFKLVAPFYDTRPCTFYANSSTNKPVQW
ncbi:MAG: DUF4249 domain-containing protein [Bacteroidetes bacterium]|nr:DUF4249 domain-containing protein [Bacteroidota bacterium]